MTIVNESIPLARHGVEIPHEFMESRALFDDGHEPGAQRQTEEGTARLERSRHHDEVSGLKKAFLLGGGRLGKMHHPPRAAAEGDLDRLPLRLGGGANERDQNLAHWQTRQSLAQMAQAVLAGRARVSHKNGAPSFTCGLEQRLARGGFFLSRKRGGRRQIHPRRDAFEFRGVLAQEIFESATVLGRLHRGEIQSAGENDRVRAGDAGLEEIHAAVELEHIWEPLAGQVREREIVTPEMPLVFEAHRREDGWNLEALVAREDRHERGLPAEGVDDIRRLAAGEFDDCFGEKNEAGRVVLVVAAVHAVEPGAVEKLVALEEDQPHPAGARRLPNLGLQAVRAEFDVQAEFSAFEAGDATLANATVEGQNDRGFVPGGGGRGGQTLDISGEIPGLREGGEFARGDQNFHGRIMNSAARESRTKRKTPPKRGFRKNFSREAAYLPAFSSMYLMTSPTLWSFSASSSGTSTPNSSSKAITSSTVSRESAPRSSMNEAVGVTCSAFTPSCSTMISLTFSSMDFSDMGFRLVGMSLMSAPPVCNKENLGRTPRGGR